MHVFAASSEGLDEGVPVVLGQLAHRRSEISEVVGALVPLFAGVALHVLEVHLVRDDVK